MIDIKFEEVQEWYQGMLQQKYRERFSILKKAFLSFYNLVNQTSILYYNILEETQRMCLNSEISQSIKLQQTIALNKIINRSLIILSKMSETKGSPIDKASCEKFSNTFEMNLNILCTYYHSLNHCQIVKEKFNFEKKKIVEGINKLFALHSKIKDLYKNRHYNQLKSITHQKKVISSSIKMIQDKNQHFHIKSQQIDSFEKQIIDFYQSFLQSAEKIQENSRPIQQIMKVYFKILHQFYQTQAELQFLLRSLINYCEQLRQRKKSSTSCIADAYNTFTRVSSQLLKSNYSLKTIKKLKLQDFSKALYILLEDLSNSQIQQNSISENTHSKIENIMQCISFMMDCIKQIDKVQSSGIFTTIQEYKEKVSPAETKKIISKILEYQKYIAGYYQVQYLIKQFQISISQMALKQFGIKVNVEVSDPLQTLNQKPLSENTSNLSSSQKKHKNTSLNDTTRVSKQILTK